MPSEINLETRSSLRMGWVKRVPSGMGGPSRRRNPRAVTLIQCKRGSLALITHFGAWKLDEIGLYPKIRWAVRNWPSSCTKTSARRMLSKLSLLTKLMFGSAVCLSTKSSRTPKNLLSDVKKKKTDQTHMNRENLQISTLDLRPHLAVPLSLGREGHHAIPLTRSKNPC